MAIIIAIIIADPLTSSMSTKFCYCIRLRQCNNYANLAGMYLANANIVPTRVSNRAKDVPMWLPLRISPKK